MTREIWLLLDTRRPGGIETHVVQLAQGLRSHGRTARVVLLKDHGPHPLRAQLAARDIPVTVLDGSPLALLGALQRGRPSTLHTHGYKAGILGRLAAVLTRTPVFSTYHAGEVGHGRLGLYDWLDCHTAWLTRGAFAVSREVAARIPSTTRVLDNFLETSGVPRSRGTQIAFVGRLSHEKGPDRFFNLAARHPDVSFHVYGGGTMAPGGAGLKDNLHLHGEQADMDRIWQEIGLLVMPSRHEGLPMAALEAMARGIPVLASRVGALPELIEHGRNGWVVEQDDLVAFDRHIASWLLMSPADRCRVGDAAVERIATRYSTQYAIPPLLAAYDG